MYLLQPVYMFLSLGILIPIAIHLWNIQQGKILQVGSVALLNKDAVKNTSRIKLHDLLLLALRCLLIILLSLFLSQPQWVTKPGTNKGWVLIDKNDLKQTYTHFKLQVDSLLQAGFELHYFNKGFDKTVLTDTTNIKSDATNTNYWVTLAQLNSTKGVDVPLYIFTNSYLQNFTGERATAASNIHWYSYAPNDTASYIANSYTIQGDSVQLITVNSSATGNSNVYSSIALQNAGAGIDTNTLHVSIYNKGYATDAAYLQAAINAIQQFSHKKLTITNVNNIAQLPAKQDWLFWLSNEAIPQNITANKLFVYAQGKEQDVQTWLGINKSANPIVIYKRIAGGISGYTVWSDGFGNGLLTRVDGRPTIYRFYSRFDVQWNDLSWSNDFPQMMYGLLYNTSTGAALNNNDKRIIDDKQLQPVISKEYKLHNKQALSVSINNIILLLAFITFFIERYFSNRVKKGAANA